MKKVKHDTKYTYVPKKVYLYNSVTESLRSLVQREGVLKLLCRWRERTQFEDTLMDIMDGQVWKDFMFVNGRPFLEIATNLALILNVDWFTPYEHTQYSVGVIYLIVANLPRSERYKLENVLVVGCIPGPKEPKHSINTYLSFMVDELEVLWDAGIQVSVNTNPTPITIRAALVAVVCDIPACRKVCGFTGFQAKLGCSKCLKIFPSGSFGEKLDYSGFDRSVWPLRTLENHMKALGCISNAKSPTEQLSLESKYGSRYSELTRLPYFNVIDHHVVDPMHNLYLGTTKNMVKIWKELSILKAEQCDLIQERIDTMNVPFGIGRIPNKVHSKFSGLTADQWRNWTNVYSLYALRDVLPADDYLCWSLFVEASIVLCQYSISKGDLEYADDKLIQFCKMFEELYGAEKCTPNMHLHGHIKDCMLKYGPIAAFWAFAFERYNGVLEKFVSNWLSPEHQMMNRFLLYQQRIDTNSLQSIEENFPELFRLCNDSNSVGALQHYVNDGVTATLYSQNAFSDNLSQIEAVLQPFHDISSSRLFEKYLSDSDVVFLQEVYSNLYPADNAFNFVPKRHVIINDLSVLGERFLSRRSRSERSAVVMANWCRSACAIGLNGTQFMAGEVQFYFLHTMDISTCATGAKTKKVEHIFAKVKWFQTHQRPKEFGYPLLVVSTVFESEGPASIIPLSRIVCRCAISNRLSITFDYGEDNVHIVCPYFQNRIISPQLWI